jgi:HSP20 family protein
MERERIAPVVRKKIIKAVRESLAESWEDPFWAQLEDADLDARTPPIDIQDRDDHLLLIAEMPGIPKEKVDLTVHENMVEISGENVLECELGHEDLAYLCNERAITNFHRKVPLPTAVLPAGAEASMELGVLIVKMPKKSEPETTPVRLDIS